VILHTLHSAQTLQSIELSGTKRNFVHASIFVLELECSTVNSLHPNLIGDVYISSSAQAAFELPWGWGLNPQLFSQPR